MNIIKKVQHGMRVGLIVIFTVISISKSDASSRQGSFTHRQFMPNRLTLMNGDFDFESEYIRERNQIENPNSIQAQNLIEWVPHGSYISPVPPICTVESFEEQIKNRSSTTADFGKMVQHYLNLCGEDLAKEATGGLLGLLDFALVSYPFAQNELIKKFVYETPEGRHLHGYIGIKDKTPRPWVIYKCGVFCSARENSASVKNYLIHLFDQSPFNVIVLENRTGTDYIEANQVFNMGGHFESQDFVDVALWLRNKSPYSQLVSSVHVMAVSLAGNGAYFIERALAEKSNGATAGDKAPIQSVSSLCAVSDLKPTVNDMFSDSLKGMVFSELTWHYLKSVRSSLPLAQDLLGEDKPSRETFPSLLGAISVRYLNLSDENQIPSFFASLRSLEDYFWERGQYSNNQESIHIPTFVFSSKDDSVVDYGINMGRLYKNRTLTEQDNLGLTYARKGDHCGFATAYGFAPTSAILRQFILMNSPEFDLREKTKTVKFRTNLNPLRPNEKIVTYWWSQNPQKPGEIQLNFNLYSDPEQRCSEDQVYSTLAPCHRFVSVEFSSSFFNKIGFKPHKSNIQLEILVRELNGLSHLSLDGKSVIDTNEWPNRIHFRYRD